MAVRLLQVGAGTRGRHWLEILGDRPDMAPVGVVDPGIPAGPAAGLPAFADLDAALDAVRADAALIASPSVFHAGQAVRCLEAGLHVMVEKPFAMSVAQARQVLTAAERAGRQVVVAENFRFFPAERTVRRLLADGRLGGIRTVTCVDRRCQPPADLGPYASALPAPQLVEIAVHHFDSFRYFFDRRPASVTARTFNPPGSPYASGAGTEAVIELEGDLAILYLGALTSHRYEYALWIEGERGSLWTDRRRVWWRRRGWPLFRPVRLVPVPAGDARRYPRAGTASLLDALREAVVAGRAPETSGHDNVWTIAMVEAALRADRERRRVAVAEVLAAAGPGGAVPGGPSRPAREPDRLPAMVAPAATARPGGRLLVIGLDTADAGLVERWCDEGHLPVLRALRRAGVWGRLATTAEALHVSAWPSVYTGTTPDRHGLYHAYVTAPGRQGPERPRPEESPEPVFWKLLSDAGRRGVVMDAFLSCPVEPFNGVQILEYGTWTWFWEPMTSPAGLRREIRSRFGPYPAEDHGRVLAPPDPAGFRDRLVRGAETKARVVRWLMAREPWDYVLVVFGESHPAGHYLWHLHDPACPAHPAAGAGRLATALRDVYVALDRAIGEVLAGADEQTTVLVVSADGVGPNCSGSHLLDEVLRRLGLYVMTGERGAPATPGRAAGRRNPAKRLRDLVPTGLRTAASRHLFPRHLRERLAQRWMTAETVWSRTRAFPISNANEGFVRLNLAGREPEGIVRPGDYDALCEGLVETFGALVNPRTGRRAARAVWRADRRYAGPRRDRLPDVVVNWDPAAGITTELFAPACGLVRVSRPPWEVSPYYTGNHHPAAFVLARGPGLAAGRVLAGGHILDLAPTVLAHFGLPPPAAMDGAVLRDLLPGGGQER